MLKRCPKCSRQLPESEFNWKIKGLKRAVHCKDCARKYIREHYKNNLQYYLEKTRKRNHRIMAECHKYIGDYLLSHPCVDCGEKDILVLEFDHKDRQEKQFNISTMNRKGYSFERVVDEISKCEVRCANCHRRKTAKETNSWKINFAPVA